MGGPNKVRRGGKNFQKLVSGGGTFIKHKRVTLLHMCYCTGMALTFHILNLSHTRVGLSYRRELFDSTGKTSLRFLAVCYYFLINHFLIKCVCTIFQSDSKIHLKIFINLFTISLSCVFTFVTLLLQCRCRRGLTLNYFNEHT